MVDILRLFDILTNTIFDMCDTLFQKEKSWIYFLIWTIVALRQQNQEAANLATMALQSASGFLLVVFELHVTYIKHRRKKTQFSFLQTFSFLSGLAAMFFFFGPMLELPYDIRSSWCRCYVLSLVKNVDRYVIGSTLGFGLLLYGFASFVRTRPEYFIFHSYSSHSKMWM